MHPFTAFRWIQTRNRALCQNKNRPGPLVDKLVVQVPWLVSYVETLLVQTWYPMTVATNSFHHKLKEIH
jgi:hypothetical protein